MIASDFVGPGVSAFVALLVPTIGWAWYLTVRTSKIDYLDNRLTALEVAMAARSQRLEDMADRLARLEPMIAFLVEQLKTRKQV